MACPSLFVKPPCQYPVYATVIKYFCHAFVKAVVDAIGVLVGLQHMRFRHKLVATCFVDTLNHQNKYISKLYKSHNFGRNPVPCLSLPCAPD